MIGKNFFRISLNLTTSCLLNSKRSAHVWVKQSLLPVSCSVSAPKPYLTLSQRNKHRKRTPTTENDDDEEENRILDEPGSKVITGYMTSLRADLVLKTGLGLSRNKVETMFYESKIRVNGRKILKKSCKVDVGDEVDLIKEPHPQNDSMLIVSRVTVLSAEEHDDEDKLVVKMRRIKSLPIENNENEF